MERCKLVKNHIRYGVLPIAVFWMMTGCSAYFQPANPESVYQDKIREWQHRQESEGWTSTLVRDIVAGCLLVVKYESEPFPKDHWKTYAELVKSNFRGDCEDITFFAGMTLRKLGYPYGIKGVIYRNPLIKVGGYYMDHTVLSVQMPDGRWRVFNSVGASGEFDRLISFRLAEFDLPDPERSTMIVKQTP